MSLKLKFPLYFLPKFNTGEICVVMFNSPVFCTNSVMSSLLLLMTVVFHFKCQFTQWYVKEILCIWFHDMQT